MAREFYGPVAVTAPTPATTDGTAIGYVSTALFVYRTRTSGVAETDLQTLAGTTITTVTPDASTGALAFLGPDGYTGTLWVADPSGTRWPVFPSSLADRPIVLAGDLRGVAVSGPPPTPGQVLTAVSATAAVWAAPGSVVDIPPTVALVTSAVTANSVTLSWTVDPGSYDVEGTYQGRDPVGALPAYESSAMTTGLTGSRTYSSLPSGTPVTLYVRPVVDGVPGSRVDVTVSTLAAGSAPANTTPPAITGLAQVGQTLACSEGTWTGGPTGFTYQWKADGVNISGATGPTRLLAAGQQGAVISCAVTGTNAVGPTTALSNETAVVAAAPGSPPANTALPTITGTAKVGTALTSSLGTWTNSPSLVRQWQSKEATSSTWVDIAGATAATYTPVAGNAGDTLRVRVIGTNSSGTATAYSTATGTVAPLTSTGFTVPSGYNLFYGRDFTVANAADDADWEVYTGTQGNNNGNFRSANVVKSGANGQELIANRTSDTATIYSGAVKNYGIVLPQYFYLKYTFKLMNFAHGSWPSCWSRPHPDSGGGEGEIDYMEAFGGHIGSGLPRIIASTIILTPYGSAQTNVNDDDWGMAAGTFYGSPGVYGSTMVVEVRKIANQMTTTVNGTLRNTLLRPSAAGAKWDAQMEDTTKKWYVRLDHQAGGTQGQAGNPDAGWRESRQSMMELVIGVPS